MSSAWILFVAGKIQEGEVTSRAAPFPRAPCCPQEHSAPSPQEVWGSRQGAKGLWEPAETTLQGENAALGHEGSREQAGHRLQGFRCVARR